MKTRDYIALIADIITVLSMILTIVTLCTTVGIRKSLLSHIEKADYLQGIDDKIKALRSYEDTIKKDAVLCNDKLYDLIEETLDDILTSYETILKRNIISKIKALLSHVQESKSNNTDSAKNECKRQLHTLCIILEKEKKLI